MPYAIRRSYASYARRSMPRRRGFKPTVRKPYGNRYGNDAFVKCESIEPLSTGSTTATQENVFSTMRVNTPAVGPGNTYLGLNQEFLSFQPLYARYEVRGMKAEVTIAPRSTWQAANLAAGLSPNLNNPALFPSIDSNVTYPVQKDCNVQGEKTSIYYAFSKDLKNSGAAFAIATTQAFTDQDQGIVQFRGRVIGAAANTVVGSIKFTWYVRFHGRTRPAGQVLPAPLREPMKDMTSHVMNSCAMSETPSYADLQQQIRDLQAK